MSRTHRNRLMAFGAAVFLIVWALLTRSGSSSGASGAAVGTVGVDGGGTSGDGPDGEGRQGEFRRRNPFQIVRAHPPPEPTTPAATRAAPTTPVLPPPPSAPPQQPLPLKLIGTIAGGPLGVAFVKNLGNGQEMMLNLGDNLGSYLDGQWLGVVLTRVSRNEVQFQRGTQQWKLEVGDDPKGAPAVRPLAYRPGQPAPAAAPPATTPVATTQKVVSKGEVEKNLKNLGFLISQLSVQPFFKNGQPSGFRVSRIRPGSWVDKMGARNGDIVQAVNGKPVRTIKDAFLLYNGFKTERSVQVSVLRNGQPATLGYQIR